MINKGDYYIMAGIRLNIVTSTELITTTIIDLHTTMKRKAITTAMSVKQCL
jgi:hypothetical protein